MQFLSVALAVLASASLAGAQNKYLCPAGETDETITVNNKAKLQFMVAKKTAHNMDCSANYVMGTCSRVKLVCKFKLNGKGKACSGDQALITANGKTTTLCKGKKGKLSANVNGDFSIQVITDGSKPSKGGKCTIRCTKKGKPKPTTTTAAPTPPPTTGTTTETTTKDVTTITTTTTAATTTTVISGSGIVSPPLTENTIYVDGVSGSDSNDGLSESSGLKTLRKAINVCHK